MSEEAFFFKDKEIILLKKTLAKDLYNNGMDQSIISQILKLSQPMISNYISSNEYIPDNIRNFSKKIIKEIKNNNKLYFNNCITFSDTISTGKYYIAEKNEIINHVNKKIINHLTEAFYILKDNNLQGLIPKIKINIAEAKDNPKDSDDVASFSNGLIIIDDKISAMNGIRFGKSKHLSSLLIYLKERIEVNAIMNIAFLEQRKIKNFRYDFLTNDFKIKKKKSKIDILLHKGDFGIEPCSYILGKDAIDVAKKVIRLKEEI